MEKDFFELTDDDFRNQGLTEEEIKLTREKYNKTMNELIDKVKSGEGKGIFKILQEQELDWFEKFSALHMFDDGRENKYYEYQKDFEEFLISHSMKLYARILILETQAWRAENLRLSGDKSNELFKKKKKCSNDG